MSERQMTREEERIESLEGQLLALAEELQLWRRRAEAAETELERMSRRVEELERNP